MATVSREVPFLLPRFGYYLDESDPDVLVLRRQDGTFVGAFSASGATKEGIGEAAEEDYGALLREHADQLGPPTEEHKGDVEPQRQPRLRGHLRGHGGQPEQDLEVQGGPVGRS